MQPLDRLDTATEAALRESIRRWGVIVPVVRDQHGRTIDGHHREEIAVALDVACPVEIVNVTSDDEARELAVSLNVDRRQLDPEQRRRIVEELRKSGHSLRAISGAVGVAQTTVRRDLAGVPPGAPDATITGRDGKQYPPTRKAQRTRVVELSSDTDFADDAETVCPTCHGTGRVPVMEGAFA